jgi:prevent-host-death family protein
MRTVGIFEAKTRLSELVTEAEQGETIRLTRNGKPVARIVPEPPDEDKEVRMRRQLRELEELRARIFAHGGGATRDEIQRWIKEGRK